MLGPIVKWPHVQRLWHWEWDPPDLQGSCLSPALFSLYMDELLQEMRNLGVGCYVGGVFAGAGSYCDDLVLLAPTRSELQTLMTICERYALEHNLTFSTDPSPAQSKSKCLLFKLHNGEGLPAPIVLNGEKLPWVDHAAHLGHELHTSGGQEMDCNMRRGAYIGESVELLNVFEHAHPSQKLAAIQTYFCSFYGSNLWDLLDQLPTNSTGLGRSLFGMPGECQEQQEHTLLTICYPHPSLMSNS